MTLSKSQIDKLGERLGTAAAEADLRELNEFVAGQDPVRLEVEDGLRALCADQPITSRLKTKTSIIEKLQRQHTRLSEMQDIVGVRVVTHGGRPAQDALVQKIRERWPKHKLHDRRLTPQHGYRAVHIVVNVRGRPVEIQVRTGRQHQWAEVFEKVADKWGRAIRYGGAPSPEFSSKVSIVLELQRLSNLIDEWEPVEQEYVVSEVLVHIERYLLNLHHQLLEET